MGEVYRAQDTRLGREVAIKVVPHALAGDAEQMARLNREARTLAALNHPNVGAIYGIEESGGERYLILELVSGETLAERLARGPLPADEALALCRQIASGLEAAHERAVVHRDIKPANVMVTPDGVAKILDFGLAKPVLSEVVGSELSTAGPGWTVPGAITGTVGYMSPEQARGLAVDERTDIWAFGCVAYEALTGRRLFSGPTPADTLLAILSQDADLKGLPKSVPPRARQLIERCLRRELRRRLCHQASSSVLWT